MRVFFVFCIAVPFEIRSSENNPLFQLYRYLARRTSSKFNKIIMRRLFMSKINRPPLSIARIVRYMKKPGQEKKIVVVVGTVTDDARIFQIPKLTVRRVFWRAFL
jgi:large subunit ribosomal protein L18e